MSYYRNPDPAYSEEEEDPRPRDRWGRFLPFVLEGEHDEPIDDDEPIEDDDDDDDDYEDDE